MNPLSDLRESGAMAEASAEHGGLMGLWEADVDWVCVDMFDTLVMRTINPEDVKRHACERLARIAGLGIDGETLYRWRAATEARLCQQNAAAGFDQEFDLDACLASLAEQARRLGMGDSAAIIERGKDVEIATECAVQRLYSDVEAFVRSRPPDGPRLALVSDFYLGATDLRSLLRFHGLADHFDTVISSADDLLSKRSGRRYQALVEALGCTPQRMVMVGDNPVADIEQARSHGLAAWHLDRSARHETYADLGTTSGDLERTAREVDEILHAEADAVFPELALTLYCFIERLYDTLLTLGVQDAFFLSREGQPLRSLFDSYQARRDPAGILRIRSHYLEASRRSLFLPSLDRLPDERFEMLFRQYRGISWGEFLRSLGLESVIEDLQASVGTDPVQRSADLPTSPEFGRLLEAPLFMERYEEERRLRRRAFLAYLGDVQGEAPSSDLTIVDVGWKGTMQDTLVQLLDAADRDHAPKVTGLYMGLVGGGAMSGASPKHGLLFSSIGQRTPWYNVFNENRPLFEVMLAADHASTWSYGFDDRGRALPIRDDFPEEPMIKGQVLPALSMVTETFHRLDDLLTSRRYTPRWLLGLAARHHARMVYSATDREIDWFTHLYHVENFGVFERSTFGYPPLSPLRRARFAASLLRRRGRARLGLWPWLQCVQQGGRTVGAAYSAARRLQATRER